MLTVVQAMDFQQMIKQDIKPALKANKVVLCDRYFYTGLARGVARGLNYTWLKHLFVNNSIPEPDLTFYHRYASPPPKKKNKTKLLKLSISCYWSSTFQILNISIGSVFIKDVRLRWLCQECSREQTRTLQNCLMIHWTTKWL